MCLIFVALERHPAHRLIVAANRDELYRRPTAAARFWDDAPDVLAGKDMEAGGTWLGVTRNARFAALTNFPDVEPRAPGAPSRGALVRDFLTGHDSASAYAARLPGEAGTYNGYGLLLADREALYYYTNRGLGSPRRLGAGLYGLSNHLLDTPWPKVERGKQVLGELLAREALSVDALLDLMAEREAPPDAALPDTGVGLEMERALAPLFICTPAYGTRSTTVVLIDYDGRVSFTERTFDATGKQRSQVHHEFVIEVDQ